MKRWHYIVLVGLAIFAGYLVYAYRQEIGLVGPHSFASRSDASSPLSSDRAARITWQAVDRNADGFKVDMPVDVKQIQIPAYNESGGTDAVNMIFANPDAETSFSVAWADNPPVARVNGRSPDRILDMARDEELARTQTSLVSESRSTPGGFPARDIVAQNSGGGVIDSRLIYTGERLYMLIAAFPSMGARREQDVRRFYNSFQALDTASPGKSRTAEPRR